jgi:hypothetical protein
MPSNAQRTTAQEFVLRPILNGPVSDPGEAVIQLDEATGKVRVSVDGEAFKEMAPETGSGSGFDADTVDGQHAAAFCLSGDSRLSDARTPTGHAATHVAGGSDIIANAVAAGNSGLMTGADKTKLDGVASGATANATDAQGEIDTVPAFVNAGLTAANLADAEAALSSIKNTLNGALVALTLLARLP